MRPLTIPKPQIFKSLKMRQKLVNPETLPETDPKSLPCKPTWASVVANGIRDAPKYPASPKLDKSQALPSNSMLRPSNAKPLLSSSCSSKSASSASTPSPSLSAGCNSASSSINPVWYECDTLSSKSRKHKSKKKSKSKAKAKAKAKAKQETSPPPSPSPSPLSSPLPLASPSILLPELQQSSRNEETLQSGASVNGSSNGMHYNDNRYQKTQNGYRSRRHPHCPTPMGSRPRRVRSRTSLGSLLESDQRYAPGEHWPGMTQSQSQQMDDQLTTLLWNDADDFADGNTYGSNNWDNYRGNYRSNYSSNYSNNNIPNYNSDNDQLHLQSVSPGERDRCQETSAHDACNTNSWDMVGNSRQVWDPLLRDQRSQDPSLPITAPPPGSEHIPMGKMLLCSRARQLLGEQVNCWQHTEYTAPQPMIQPEQELREQLHFIGKHDTHLTWRPSQLRVTNGGTGDGYYVRSVSNPLLYAIKKERVQPKEPSTYPKISYWNLLSRNRETNDMETAPQTVDPISQTDADPFNSIDQNIDREEFNLNLMMSSN